MRPRSSVGRVTVDLFRRSWVRFPPRSKDFFFTSCGSLIPLTRANAQWVIYGSISTLIYTAELILDAPTKRYVFLQKNNSKNKRTEMVLKPEEFENAGFAFSCGSLFHHLCSWCYAAQHLYVPLFSLRRVSPPKSSPTFSVRPRSSVGRVTVDLFQRSWVRFPPRSKDFFFTSCGSLIPLTRANAQWVIYGFNKYFNLHCRVNSRRAD